VSAAYLSHRTVHFLARVIQTLAHWTTHNVCLEPVDTVHLTDRALASHELLLITVIIIPLLRFPPVDIIVVLIPSINVLVVLII
jgi:hypothetical protein